VDDIRKHLEEQVDEFKATKALDTAIAFNNKDVVDKDLGMPSIQGNFSKVQKQLNQVQIDNRNLSGENNVLKQRLQNKDRLVAHLENKVTQIMLENEEVILKLQSEIVLLKNQVNSNEEQMVKRVAGIKEKLKDETEENRVRNIKDLEESTEKLKRENGLQKTRIDELLKDYQDLKDQYDNYRNEKQQQEDQK
jgi:chromosome segregation ATPase